MSLEEEIREFLFSRRARLSPAHVGLPAGQKRRVPGLRREEVAVLAGVSVDYYVRVERGNLLGVSDRVLDALARALLLDAAETRYLHDLAGAANDTVTQKDLPVSDIPVSPRVQRIVDSMSGPTWVRNGRMDLLTANQLGRALYAPLFESRHQPANAARFTFLDPASQSFYEDWSGTAAEIVAALRAEAGRHPHDTALVELVGLLTTNSDSFSELWAARNVRQNYSGTKRLHHPSVGELDLQFDALTIDADPSLTVITYFAPAGSATALSLSLLQPWDSTSADAGPARRSKPSSETRYERSESSESNDAT